MVLTVIVLAAAGGLYMLRRSSFPSQLQIGSVPADEAKPATDPSVAANQPAAPETGAPAPPVAPAAPAAPKADGTSTLAAGTPLPVKPGGRAAGAADPNLPGATAGTATAAPGARGARGAAPGATPETTAGIPPPEPAPAAPPVPSTASVTFSDVRVIVKDGDKSRELGGVLALGDGHITVLDRPGGNALVSLPYASVTEAAYSRSKQPKWKDAQGKDVEAKVDLGKLGFLKSDRNWVILFSHGEPTFLRVEDSSLRPVRDAIESHAGVKFRR
jgi:hypothetical protein